MIFKHPYIMAQCVVYVKYLFTMVLHFYIYTGDGDLLNSALLIQEEATKAMIKMTYPIPTPRIVTRKKSLPGMTLVKLTVM